MTTVQTTRADAVKTAQASTAISPLRRFPLRLFLVCLLLLVAAVPWRRGAFYSGAMDTVVVGKAVLTLIALGLVLTTRHGGARWAELRAGPVPWLAAYAALATTGAALTGDAFASAVLAGRLGLLTLTLVLLFHRYPKELVLSALTAAMLALAVFSGLTGLGSLASEGRLYGGIPPTNANEIALLVSVPLLCLFWRMVQRVARTAEVLAIAPLLGLLWLTGTRTGLAALVLALLVLLVMTPRVPVPVVAAGIAAIPTLLYVMFWTPLLSSYVTRGDATGLLTLNSRTVAWTAALEYPDTLAERLLGVGLAVKKVPVSAMYRNEQMLDSTWISALVQSGVLGAALLVLTVLLVAIRTLTVAPPQRSLLTAALVLLVVRSVLESGMFDTSVSFISFFCFAMAAQVVATRRSS